MHSTIPGTPSIHVGLTELIPLLNRHDSEIVSLPTVKLLRSDVKSYNAWESHGFSLLPSRSRKQQLRRKMKGVCCRRYVQTSLSCYPKFTRVKIRHSQQHPLASNLNQIAVQSFARHAINQRQQWNSTNPFMQSDVSQKRISLVMAAAAAAVTFTPASSKRAAYIELPV